MDTQVDEIADGIYRLSTYIPEVAPPAGFTFNQFLVVADEPLLFHCGMRSLFPGLAAAAAKVMPLARLRWISFGHVEADECGSMNQWLAAAPGAQVMHSAMSCGVSLNDMSDRPPRSLADDEIVDLGGKRVRFLATPHVPHGWDAGVMYEESTGTLLCGDLFTHAGRVAALTNMDILAAAVEAERLFRSTALTPATAPTLCRLAELEPKTLALMHGSAFIGDGGSALRELAAFYAQELERAMGAGAQGTLH